MATPNKNAKSQLTTVRIPNGVMEKMEQVKQEGESNAGFIVTSMRGEIARRQLRESDESKVLSNLKDAREALRQIAQMGLKVDADICAIVNVARAATRGKN